MEVVDCLGSKGGKSVLRDDVVTEEVGGWGVG